MALTLSVAIPKASCQAQCTAFLGVDVCSFEVPSAKSVSLICISEEEILKLVFTCNDEVWTLQGTLKSLLAKHHQRLTLENKCSGPSFWLDFALTLTHPPEPTCPKCEVWRRAAESIQENQQSCIDPALLKELESVQLGRIRTALPMTLVEQDDAHLKTTLAYAAEQGKLADLLNAEVERLNALVKELLERPEVPAWPQKCQCTELQAAKLQIEGELTNCRIQLQAQKAHITETETRLQLLTAELQIAAAQQLNASTLSKELQQLRNALALSEDQRMTLLRDMIQAQREWKNRLAEAQKDVKQMASERDNGLAQVQQLSEALATAQSEFAQMQAKREEDDRLRQERRAVPRKEALQLSQRVEDLAHANESLLLDKAQLQSALDILEEQLQERETEVHGLRREMQQGRSSQEDLSLLRSQLAAYGEASKALKAQLSTELPQLVQLLAAGKQQKKLEDTVKAQEKELNELRGALFRPTPEYVAQGGDLVDQTLANYLNARRGALPVPFQRKDPGVYQFGSKRVFIRVENGVIIVRVGGGYMNIEEFLKLYTPLELGRIQETFQTAQQLEGRLEEGRFVECVGIRKRSK